jgi:membrane protein
MEKGKAKSWARTHSLPGFFSVPLYDVIIFLLKEIRRDDLFTRANAMAYSFFLSLFPSLMALFTLIPLLKRYFLIYLPEGENFESLLEQQIHRIMPGVAGDRLFNFIEDITSSPRVALLSFGFFLALFFASNGMLMLMRGFEKSYSSTYHKRTAIGKRLMAIGLTFQLGFLVIVSVVLIIIGNYLIKEFSALVGLDEISTTMLNILRWIIVIALYYTSIATIYRFGAATKRKFRMFTPGATLATVLSISASLAFSAYVNNFNTYNELYGSIGTIIVIMLWLQINSQVLLLGYELNASIAVNRDMRLLLTEEED